VHSYKYFLRTKIKIYSLHAEKYIFNSYFLSNKSKIHEFITVLLGEKNSNKKVANTM